MENASSSIGSLYVLPEEVLQQVFDHLSAMHVRGASRALRSAFDAFNPRLAFNNTLDNAMHEDELASCAGLIRRTPQLEDLSMIAIETGMLNTMMEAMVTTLPLPRVRRLHISVSTMFVSRIDLMRLASLLDGLPSLEDVTLSGYTSSGFTDEAGMQRVMQSLAQLPELRSLCLMYNCGMTLFAPGIRALTGLRKLNVSKHILSFDAATSLAGSFSALKALRSLRLADVCLRLQTIGDCLLPGLCALTGLRTLDISSNKYFFYSSIDNIQPLESTLATLTGLRSLIMRDTWMAYTALPPTLLSLTRLDLYGCSLGANGDEEIESENRIVAERAGVLAPVLRTLTKLQYLDLGNAKLRTAGAQAVAPALERLLSMRTLLLDRNRLGAAGAAALHPALKALTGLRRLCLAGNDLVATDVNLLATEATNRMPELHELEV